MILLIDNYDSFSYNLYQLIGSVNPDVQVVRNDAVSLEEIEKIQDVLKRTRDFWVEKTTDPSLADKTVLVSSHGCAVRALLQNLYQDPEHFWHGCVPPNCIINLVEVKVGKSRFLEEDKVYA